MEMSEFESYEDVRAALELRYRPGLTDIMGTFAFHTQG